MASEAMENLAMRIDVEAGAFLAVKRTESNEVCARSFEGEHRAYDIDDVTGSANLLESCRRNESGHIIAWPIPLTLIKHIVDLAFPRANDAMPPERFFFGHCGLD